MITNLHVKPLHIKITVEISKNAGDHSKEKNNQRFAAKGCFVGELCDLVLSKCWTVFSGFIKPNCGGDVCVHRGKNQTKTLTQISLWTVYTGINEERNIQG